MIFVDEPLKVVYLRPGKSDGYLRVGIEDGEITHDLTVTEAEYRAHGAPSSGNILTRDSLDALRLADMRYRSRLKALRMLSLGDNSEKMLLRKLLAAGIKREVACDTVREVVSLGYINERRQLEALIKNEVDRRMTGPRKITQKLAAKGYSVKDINSVIAELSRTGEISLEDARARLIASKLPSDADGESLKKLLYKNGFSVE